MDVDRVLRQIRTQVRPTVSHEYFITPITLVGGTTAASHGLHANAYYEYLIYILAWSWLQAISSNADVRNSDESRRYGAGASGGASVSYIGAANFAAGVALVAAIEEAGSLDSKIVSETLKKLEIDEFYNLDFRTSNGSHQNGVRRQILTHHRLFHRQFFWFENAREEDPPAILLESVTCCATIHVRYLDVRLTTIC